MKELESICRGGGTPGRAGDVQQAALASEQHDCSALINNLKAEYSLQNQLAKVDDALRCICASDVAFFDHRAGLLPWDYFQLETPTYKLAITVKSSDGGRP